MTVQSAVAPEGQPATRVDPVTAAVIHGALENIAIEMGHKLMRMAYSSIIRESEDFGAALTDAEGGQLCECKMSTPLQSGPIPGYIRGIRKELDETWRDDRPRRRDHAQRPLRGRLARAGRRLLRAGLSGRSVDRLLGDDRASSGHRRLDSRQRGHRQRRRRLCRRAAVQGDQGRRGRAAKPSGLAAAARQYSCASTSSSATWRRRSRRRRSAPSGFSRSCGNMGSRQSCSPTRI